VSLQLRLTNAAMPSGEPESPKPTRNLALGALAGLVLALVIAVLRQLLDNRLTTAHDLERITDRPLLGQFLREERPPRSIGTVSAFAASPGAEAVRTLRTNLRFLDPQLERQSFVVTSSAPHEDRTELAATLAIAMADLDRRVLIVDADLRRGKLASYLDLEGGIGLTDVLRGAVQVTDAMQRWGLGPMFVLPAGSGTDRPNELVQSDAMARLVTVLQQQFEVVIFTAPPLLVASDAAILANATGGALVVVEMGRTTRAQLVAALSALDRVGAETIGLVATGLRAASRPARYARRQAPGSRRVRTEREPPTSRGPAIEGGQ
jgi:capsular exopolysaccharide synthesis family protein